MPDFTVTISEEGLKAIEAADGGRCCNFQTWIQGAASDKERKSIDLLIDKLSHLNYKNAGREEKAAEVKKMNLETAKERKDREEEEEKESEDGSS